MFVILLSIAVLLCISHVYFKYCHAANRAVRKLPIPKDDFLIGSVLTIMNRTPEEIFNLGRTLAKKYKGIYGWYAFFLSAVNIYSPEDIEIVTSSMKHAEKSDIYHILNPWLNEGLLLSNGAKWMQRRKVLTPAFHFDILKKFSVTLEDNSQRLIQTLKKSNGDAIDVIPILSGFTLSSICETAMGTQLDEEASSEGKLYKQAIYSVGKCAVARWSRIYYYNDFIFSLSSYGHTFYKKLKTIKGFTSRIIKERREYANEHGIKFSDSIEDTDKELFMGGKKKKVAMLDLMLSAEKEGVIDGPGIQEEVDTFMFEGHDTTAAGLTFCLMLLANHKEIQYRIVQELDGILGDTDRPASMEDLNAMKYLENCIKESMRLYPPVPFISRSLTDSTVLSGYEIPAGVQCHIHIFDLHRRADLYPDPEKFDPDRFLPENSAERHPYAYIPFSAGPRNCIGQKFAMLEMKSCVSQILRNFELQPVTKSEDLEFTADIVLRTTNPVYVKFVERTKYSNAC